MFRYFSAPEIMNDKSLSLVTKSMAHHPCIFLNGLVGGKSWRKILEEQVPIVVWLPRYPKENLSADLAGAMTLGCILVGRGCGWAGVRNSTQLHHLKPYKKASFQYD